MIDCGVFLNFEMIYTREGAAYVRKLGLLKEIVNSTMHSKLEVS